MNRVFNVLINFTCMVSQSVFLFIWSIYHLFPLLFLSFPQNKSKLVFNSAKFQVSKLLMWVQDNISWAVGFGTLTSALGVSLAILMLGIKRYKKQGPLGSPYTTMVQVFVAAARKWRVDETCGKLCVCYGDGRTEVHVEGQPVTRTLAHSNQFRYMSSLKLNALMHI